MSLDWVRVSLRGYGDACPTGTAFFDGLGWEADAEHVVRPSESPWQAARIDLVEVTFDEVRAFEEPFEEFAARVDRGLRKAADWLLARPPGAFDRRRAAGRTADIFVGGWLTDEQFDLAFPAVFLLACGKAGLPISVCTND